MSTSPVSYQPTNIVLAKVKGYPAWPAMVLEESLLPPHILSKQPKSSKSTTTSTTTTTTTVKKIVPVRFFSDDTYIWININDIKPLTKEDIQNYFKKSNLKRKIDLLLNTAYELANDPPDMEQFIKYGSKGVPEESSEDDEVLSIPAKKKQKQAQSPKKKTKDNKIKKEPIKSKPKPKSKAKPKAKPEPKPKPKPVVVNEYDDDWGLDDFNKYDKSTGNYIYETEAEQQKVFKSIRI